MTLTWRDAAGRQHRPFAVDMHSAAAAGAAATRSAMTRPSRPGLGLLRRIGAESIR
ncbi:hypothetical protein ACRAWD_04830 [Caulobacter segnis]